MSFIGKSRAYNRLSKSFRGFFLMLQNTIIEYEDEDPEEIVYALAYVARTQILDPIEKYGWGMGNVIFIQDMPKTKMKLGEAIQITVLAMVEFAEGWGLEDEVDEILNKGPLFSSVEANIPPYVMSLINF
jgi:hypothetical protein